MLDGGVTIRLRDDFQLASVAALRDRVEAVARRAQSEFGLELRDGPLRTGGSQGDALGIGPRRWLFVVYERDDAFVTGVARCFAGLAVVCDLSDGYVLFEVSGYDASSMLSREVPVDLYPASFTVNNVAVTTVGHINVILWQREGCAEPHYCLAVPRSYAQSFGELLGAHSSVSEAHSII